MDDLSSKINELLSDPASMERIKNLAGMLAGGGLGGGLGGGASSSGNTGAGSAGTPGGAGAPVNPTVENPGGAGEAPAGAGVPGGLAGLAGLGDLPFDPALLLKLKGAMDLVNRDDPRISLLLALRPNISEPRRGKIDDAIHILRLLSLMPLLKEQGFLKNLF